jgi:tetratricopeptide (TPR) repeat protein
MESRLGPRHPATLRLRNALDFLAHSSEESIAGMIAAQERAVRLQESKLGADHPDTIASYQGLAQLYAAGGRIADAIKLWESILAIRKPKLGPNHPATLASQGALAWAYANAGRAGEAARLLEDTLGIQESKLGSDHPDTLITRSDLASMYRADGRTREAIAAYEAVLKIQESKLGADHPNTLLTRQGLATAYTAAGRHEEAIKMLRAALELEQKKLGPNHPNLVITQLRLANAYSESGRYTEEEQVRRLILRSDWARNGPTDARIAPHLALLGECLYHQSKWAAAKPELRQSLKIIEKTEPDAWTTSHTRSLLGGSLLGQGRYAESEPLIVPGFEGMKAREAKIPAERRPRLAEAAERVVRLYEAWGQPEQARAWRAKLGLADLPDDVFARP